jgi:hypothetical protein
MVLYLLLGGIGLAVGFAIEPKYGLPGAAVGMVACQLLLGFSESRRLRAQDASLVERKALRKWLLTALCCDVVVGAGFLYVLFFY